MTDKVTEQKINEKISNETEIKLRTKAILEASNLPEPIFEFEFYNTVNRLGLYVIIHDVLPANKKRILSRLRHKLGRIEWLSKRDVECLITEKLIVKRKGLYYSTPKFENYINEMWNKIQRYRARQAETYTYFDERISKLEKLMQEREV